MKRLYIIFTLLFSGILLFSQEMKKIEINGNIYCYNPIGKDLYSTKNKLKDLNTMLQCDNIRVEQYSDKPFNSVVKEVFSRQRIIDFAKNKKSFSLRLICNSKGEVLEVTYLLFNMGISENGDEENVSYKEIDSFEKTVKKYQFKLMNTCPNQKYYIINIPCRFWTMVD